MEAAAERERGQDQSSQNKAAEMLGGGRRRGAGFCTFSGKRLGAQGAPTGVAPAGWGRPRGQQRRDPTAGPWGTRAERTGTSVLPPVARSPDVSKISARTPQTGLPCLPPGSAPSWSAQGGGRAASAAWRTARGASGQDTGVRSPGPQPLLSAGTFSGSIVALLLKRRAKLIEH